MRYAVQSGEIAPEKKYINAGSSNITYNAIVYTPGQTFVGVHGVATYTGTSEVNELSFFFGVGTEQNTNPFFTDKSKFSGLGIEEKREPAYSDRSKFFGFGIQTKFPDSQFFGFGIEVVTVPVLPEKSIFFGLGIELATAPVYADKSIFRGLGIEMVLPPVFSDRSKFFGFGIEHIKAAFLGFAIKINKIGR